MSLNSTPGHTSSSSYDSHYEPSHTADLTAKMHVPDKIWVLEGAERPEYLPPRPEEVQSKMNVPERILVAGDNKHIAVRESLPELKFDVPFSYQPPNCILMPPPDVLTVEEYPYPSVDVRNSTSTDLKKRAILDQSLNGVNDFNESSMSSGYTPEEEVARLRRQVNHLSRRLLAVEQDNQQAKQREIIMYSIGIAYMFIKGVVWLHKHF